MVLLHKHFPFESVITLHTYYILPKSTFKFSIYIKQIQVIP